MAVFRSLLRADDFSNLHRSYHKSKNNQHLLSAQVEPGIMLSTPWVNCVPTLPPGEYECKYRAGPPSQHSPTPPLATMILPPQHSSNNEHTPIPEGWRFLYSKLTLLWSVSCHPGTPPNPSPPPGLVLLESISIALKYLHLAPPTVSLTHTCICTQVCAHTVPHLQSYTSSESGAICLEVICGKMQSNIDNRS